MKEVALIVTYLISIVTVINPFGAIPVFVSLVQGYSDIEMQKTLRKAVLVMCCILLVSFLFGNSLINFFGISINSLRIAGGLIIISSGFSLMYGGYQKHKNINEELQHEAAEKNDISFTPLAMPMLSGPGSISLMIGMNTNIKNYWVYLWVILAIILSGVLVYIVLRGSRKISSYLGTSGLTALSRIIGFLIVAIGIEYIAGAIGAMLQEIIH